MHALAAVDAQAFQQAVVGGFRRVGNVGDSGFVKTVFKRIHDLGGQRRAERFAFPVNDRIVPAGEVNFFKGAGSRFQRGGKFRNGMCPVCFDGEHIGRRKFLNLFAFHFKDGHQGNAFGSHGNEFIRNQVVAWADAVRIPQAEVVPVADGSHDGISAVPLLGGVMDDFLNVKPGGNGMGNFRAGHAAVPQGAVEVRMGFIQVIPYFFKDSLRVRSEDGVLAAFNHSLVQFRRIGHVEVAQNHQGAGRPVGAAQVGVAGTFVKEAGGAVAEMPHQDFPAVVEVVFDICRILQIDLAAANFFIELLDLPVEDARKGVFAGVPGAEQIRLPQGHVQLDAAYARAVLSAVVLLFHQDEQFVERPEGGAVFILKIRERLKQTNGGYAALVFKKIAHGMMMKRLSCKCGVSVARRWCFYSPCTLT